MKKEMNRNRNMNRLADALCTAAIALLLASCTAETDGNQSGSETGNVLKDVSITLTPEVPQEVETRAITEANNIKDIAIFQYSTDGTTQLQDPQNLNGSMSSTHVVRVGTLVNQASRIYIVANTLGRMRDEDLSSVAKLEAFIKTFTGEGDLCWDNSPMMTGLYIGVPQPKMNIPLVRSVSKVNLKLSASLPAGHSFTLNSVQVKQVPGKLHLVRDDLNAIPYPALTAAERIDYTATTYTDQDLVTTPVDTWWYLPENCRGTGTATSELQKNAETAPAGQADYCTYLEIKGKYSSGANWVGKLDVTYRIYLGGNNTNDYNLRRNTNYTVNTVLKGANRADTRITVTGTENAATYMDYTDNFSSWMVVGTADADDSYDMTYSTWMTGTGSGADGSLCPAGWRTPSFEELILMYVYRSMTNTDTYITNDHQSCLLFGNGVADANIWYPRGCIRCVRDI